MNDIVILSVNSKSASSGHIDATALNKYSLNEPHDNSLNEGAPMNNICEPPLRSTGNNQQSQSSNSVNPKSNKPSG